MVKVATIWSLSNHHELSTGCNQESGKVRKAGGQDEGLHHQAGLCPPKLGHCPLPVTK